MKTKTSWISFTNHDVYWICLYIHTDCRFHICQYTWVTHASLLTSLLKNPYSESSPLVACNMHCYKHQPNYHWLQSSRTWHTGEKSRAEVINCIMMGWSLQGFGNLLVDVKQNGNGVRDLCMKVNIWKFIILIRRKHILVLQL